MLLVLGVANIALRAQAHQVEDGVLWADRAEGTTVSEIADGSPAARAGLQRGDILLAVNGMPVERRADVIEYQHRGTAGTTLHYTLHFSPLTMIDDGAKGNSLGDEIVSHDIVISKARKRVGYDAQRCTITSLRPPQLECSLVFAIPGGTIAGQYIGAPPPHKLVAITGGTGKYVGASGTIEVVESGHDVSVKNTLTFRLIP